MEAEPLSPRQLNPEVPRDLENICLKAMTKEPEGRYSSASEFAADLRRFLSGELVCTRPLRWPSKVLRSCRRKPMVASLCTSLAVVTLIALASVCWQGYLVRTALVESEQRRQEAEFNYHQARQAVIDFSRTTQMDELLNLRLDV